ncbi:MAG: pilus assembly protein N-terminal domain-containing protein [Planctomycetota bacterium]
MYVKQTPRPLFLAIPARLIVTLGLTGLLFGGVQAAAAQPQVIRNITQATQRLELTVNTSRILTLEKRVPKMVVNNPELVSVTPISANQVQIAAKKPGVTQINLWDEDEQVYTVDLTIYGDVRELQDALVRLFPESSVKVLRLTNSLVLEGFVERPEAVSPIVRLAEDYAPKIVNNITVGGVQQILLKVKVMEVSRTKLRTLGVDWAQSSGTDFVTSGVSGLLSSVAASATDLTFTRADTTFEAFIADGSDAFLAVVNALQQNNVAKILADPTITAVSGRPAHFNVGGEFPILIPSGLGQSTVEFKKFGTQVDFVPIVLGNGNIRLEVRPRVSELDETRGVQLQGQSIPALKVREIDTGVEMKAGQTLALAGLVQTRIEAQERGLPFVSDLPLIGSAFRSVEEEVNEIELLILVTPEFAEGMEPHEVPQCGPGMESVSPSNCQLYWGGHLEVPAAGPCGPMGYGDGAVYQPDMAAGAAGGAAYISDGVPTTMNAEPVPMNMGSQPLYMNQSSEPIAVPPSNEATPQLPLGEPDMGTGPAGVGTIPEPSASYQPQAPWLNVQNPGEVRNPHVGVGPTIPITAQRPRSGTSTPGLMGPIGYDVE